MITTDSLIDNTCAINDTAKESDPNSPVSPTSHAGHNKEDSLSSNHGAGLGRRRGVRRYSRGKGSPSGTISRTRRNRESETKNSNNDSESYDDRVSDSGSAESSSASPTISRSNSRKSYSSRPNSGHFAFLNKSFISPDDNTLEAVPISPYDDPKNFYFNENDSS
jgi:hypothetical protein